MKLKRARVTKFRSIDDSGWVDVGSVLTLVGKNESGKTTFLQALERINPVNPEKGKFDPVQDYPRKEYSKYRRIHETEPALVVQCEFELTDNEKEKIEETFGKGALVSTTVTALKFYDNKRTWTVRLNENSAIQKIANSYSLPSQVFDKLSAFKSIRECIDFLKELDDKSPSVVQFAADLKKAFPDGLSTRVINECLVNMAPRFMLFSDYSLMEGKINIPSLMQRKAVNKLTESDQTFLALLANAEADLNDFQGTQNYETIKAQLEASSASISDDVFKFWTQNSQLKVEFDMMQGNPSDPSPFDKGMNLHLRIENTRHRATVPFGERSKGFVWFFSFLTYFSQLDGDAGELILLLDEPGLNLHAKAQADFLKFIDERLAPKYQVIYTTHSPFMIAADKLDRVCTVEDVDGVGTRIEKDVLKSNSDTVFPLQAALGYDLVQTLFVGPNNLLVEGPSDLIYLQILGSAVESRGGKSLDKSWVVVPTGGADKIFSFVSLFGGNQLNIAVLMDGNGADKQKIENLKQRSLLRQSAVIQINEITNTKAADIEDMFSEDFYLKLVNGAYKGELKSELKLSDLPKGNPRIVKRLEDYFKEKNIAGGFFSHFKPAAYLLQEQAKLLGLLDENTVGKAKLLFERVNSLSSFQDPEPVKAQPIKSNLKSSVSNRSSEVSA